MTPPLSRRGFTLALPATLAACALGPAFRKPVADTPAVFREDGAVQQL